MKLSTKAASAALLGATAWLALPSPAHAFCRATACDLSASCETEPERCCIYDGAGCETNGKPVFWPSTCISFSIQEDGSPKAGLTVETTQALVQQAFDTWQGVDCEQGGPSFSIEATAPVACGVHEFNEDAGNANIWLFRDYDWPYSSADTGGGVVNANALALTTIIYNTKTGEMYDADVELNSTDATFTTGDTQVETDFLSVATHEAGHFLGLDHSQIYDATMTTGYATGTTATRTLSIDDEAGICSIYTPDREITRNTCEPRGGLQGSCGTPDSGGCSLSAGPRPKSSWVMWTSLLLGATAVGARRLRRRASLPPGQSS